MNLVWQRARATNAQPSVGCPKTNSQSVLKRIQGSCLVNAKIDLVTLVVVLLSITEHCLPRAFSVASLFSGMTKQRVWESAPVVHGVGLGNPPRLRRRRRRRRRRNPRLRVSHDNMK